MKLSVIIPCYNGAETIADQLEALTSQEWSEEWEVIVSDNGSTDSSMQIVEGYRSRLPGLRIIDSGDRRRRAHAMNIGAAAAAGRSVVFCDADDVVAPGWLKALGEALNEHEVVASRFDMEKLCSSWTQTRMWVGQSNGLLRARFYPHFVHAGTCGLGIRRSLLDSLGGFDESIPVLADTDLCFRAQLAGAQISFVRDAVVYVRQRGKLRNSFSQSRRWAAYNVLMYKRYHVPDRMYPRPWSLYFSLWRQFILQLLKTRRKEDWAKTVWFLGWLIGLLQGSIAFDMPPLPI
jgi:GT2 family glycosyltransferase